ncbi:MAG: hypothetical protein Q7T80_17615 [Methanoregula sp.]|nr:hypothetical protein [Methanoregula sp.]
MKEPVNRADMESRVYPRSADANPDSCGRDEQENRLVPAIRFRAVNPLLFD